MDCALVGRWAALRCAAVLTCYVFSAFMAVTWGSGDGWEYQWDAYAEFRTLVEHTTRRWKKSSRYHSYTLTTTALCMSKCA